jgi:hypothetical protein
MKTTILATVAALVFTAPAFATCNICGGPDLAFGSGTGVVSSNSVTGGVAATGGLAAFGMDGNSRVQNFQGAANSSGVEGRLQFTEIDRHNRNRDVDGIIVGMDFDTYSVGVQLSQTRTLDRGVGTVGVGGGFAASNGAAHGAGGFVFQGFESW